MANISRINIEDITFDIADTWARDHNNLGNLLYPVGSIYMSVDSVSPSTLFGGTWTRITGKFLLAATDNSNSGEFQSSGKTGGVATHTLNISLDDSGDHAHTIPFGSDGNNFFSEGNYNGTAKTSWGLNVVGSYANGARRSETWTSSNGNHNHTVHINDGSNNSTYDNMPPYLAVYVWKRIA